VTHQVGGFQQRQVVMAMWRPKLSASRATPLYRRLVEAIADDIGSGRLAPGERLPPQRELAHLLSISVGAVTRAYDDAARRGLVAAHVGRGTFVVDRSRAEAGPDGLIDLSINVAPVAPVDVMVDTIAALHRTTGWAERLRYQPPCGASTSIAARRRRGWAARPASTPSIGAR
jgi:DNA-binding transcriptional MocR family regulator